MKTKIFITLLVLLSISLSVHADYQTNLLPGVYIENVDVGEFSAPVVFDWNNDGKKDLIVGSRTGTPQTGYHGFVSYYQNTGTDSSPLFSGSSYIQSCTSACSPIDALAGG